MTLLVLSRRTSIAALFVMLVWLSGCGGGSSGGASQPPATDPEPGDVSETLSGLVATGAGRESLVSVIGASGTVVRTFSGPEGDFAVSIDNLTPPYRVQAALLDTETVLYGWAESPIHTNVNQLTTRVIDEALVGRPIADFYEGQLDASSLSAESLALSEQAVKDGLVVQILSNGIDSETMSVFHTPFTPGSLGYDALLDKLDLNGLVLEQADYSALDAERMQRVLNRFTTGNANGAIRPDTEKLTLAYFEEFTQTLYQRMRTSDIVRPYIIDGTEIRDVTTASASAAVREAVLDAAIRTVIDSFGTLLGFDNADIEFLQELSSVPLGFDLFNAIQIMHNGLLGKDTSERYQALEILLERSSLGPERRDATARSVIRFFSHDMTSMVCNAPLVGERLGSAIYFDDTCTIIETNDESYTVVLDDQELRQSDVPPLFGVTTLTPQPGSITTAEQVQTPAVSLTWDAPLYGGGDSLRTEPRLILRNESRGIEFQCPTIEFDGASTLRCLFDRGSFEFDTDYSISASVESADGELTSDVFYRFSTPTWPYPDFRITPAAGTYDSPIAVSFSRSGDRSVHFRRDVGTPSVADDERTAASTALSIDTSTAISAAVFENGVRVSPVVRHLYTITEAVSPEPEPAPIPTPARPENVALKASTTSLILTWDRVDGATGYAIYVNDTGPPNNQDSTTRRYTASGSPYRLPDTEAGITYQVMVAAVNQGVESEGSEIVSSALETPTVIPDDTDTNEPPDSGEVSPCLSPNTNEACPDEARITGIYPLFVLAGVDTTINVQGSDLPEQMSLVASDGTTCTPGSFLTPNMKSFHCRFPQSTKGTLTLTVSTTDGRIITGPPLQVTVAERLPRLTGITPETIPQGGTTQVFLSGLDLPPDVSLTELSDGVSCSIEARTSTLITLSCLASTTADDQKHHSPELIVFRDGGAHTIDGSATFSFRVVEPEDEDTGTGVDPSYYRLIPGPGESTILEFGILSLGRCFFEDLTGEECDPYATSGLTALMTNRNVNDNGSISENPTSCEIFGLRPVDDYDGFNTGLIEGRCITNIKGTHRVLIMVENHDESPSLIGGNGFITEF